MKSILSVSALIAAAAAQSYTNPGSQTYGSLLTPNQDSPVTTGQTTTITWSNNAAPGSTVSLVLCNGPGANCVLQQNAIASGIPADANSYSWSVPCSLPEGVATTSTGYGMLIIVDKTGEFQYSTQFSVVKGASCGSSGSSSTTTSASVTSSVSGRPISSSTSSGWYTWTSSNSSTPAYTASSTKYTTPASLTTSAVVTSKAPVTSAAATATNQPSTYTGAAATQAAFMNAAGLLGAAGLALLAF